jgi:hypothetical protein
MPVRRDDIATAGSSNFVPEPMDEIVDSAMA